MPKFNESHSTVVERANELAGDLAVRIAPTVQATRDMAAPVLADARDKAGPAIETVKTKLTTDVLPALVAAAVVADKATEEVRGETKKRGLAAIAALRGEVALPKETHRLRNFLVVIGLGGVAAAVAKKFSDRPASTTWESTPAPVTTPSTTPSTTETGTHRADEGTDVGGASPDVVAADAASEPHAATNPDDPMETIDVSKS